MGYHITTWLGRKLFMQLEARASATGMSKSKIAADAVAFYLDLTAEAINETPASKRAKKDDQPGPRSWKTANRLDCVAAEERIRSNSAKLVH